VHTDVSKKRGVCVPCTGSVIFGDDLPDPVDRHIAQDGGLIACIEGRVGDEVTGWATIVVEGGVEVGAAAIGKPPTETWLNFAAPAVEILPKHANLVANFGQAGCEGDIVHFIVVDAHAAVVVSTAA
jgi:hypothetical protein